MKKIALLMIFCLFSAGMAMLNAQVTIGKSESAKDFSLLELNTADSKLGLRLPQLTTLQRNALTQTTDAQAAPALAKGLMIYNLDTGCVDYWNGSQWIANCDDSYKGDCLAPCDCDGDGFLFADCGGTDTDDTNSCTPTISGIAASPPNATAEIGAPVEFSISGTGAAINNLSADGGNTFVQGNKISLAANKIGANEFTIMVNNCAAQTATVTINATPCQAITGVNIDACNGWEQGYMFTYQNLQLTAAKSGAGTPLEYEWYVDGVLAAKTTTDTWTYATPPAGTHTVKVAAANACGKVESADYPVRVVAATYGILTPVKLNREGGGTLKFAHVNLGAEFDLNPCQMLGDLYQWGRKGDGHQKRDSEVVSGPISGNDALDADGQARIGTAAYAKFIRASSSPHDWRSPQLNTLWGDGTQNESQPKAKADPCPSGWKVPSQKQWQYIYKTTGKGDPGAATANSWTKLGAFAPNSSSGYIVGEALFLPAAGFRRDSSADLSSPGSIGYYRTGTVINTYSYYLLFSNTNVDPGYNYYRAHGLSVRCIEDRDYVVVPAFDPSSLAVGNGSLNGKTCFDIAESKSDATAGELIARQAEKTNFEIRDLNDKKKNAGSASDLNYAVGDNAITYSGIKQYVFTPVGTVSNVRFAYVDPSGIVVKSISGGNSGNNISTAVTATVEYKEDLNTRLQGTSRAQAKKVDIYAIYNDAANGTGTDKAVKLTATFQDAACCGANTTNDGIAVTGWLNFMCHNLGADQRLDPFMPMEGLYGDFYQWGRPNDGHQHMEPRNADSGTYPHRYTNVLANANTPGHDRFILVSRSPYDWRSGGRNDNRWGDGTQNENQSKAANDPCPTGWKVPSKQQWSSIFKGNIGYGLATDVSANIWTPIVHPDDPYLIYGYKIGERLFLPAVGNRNFNSGSLNDVYIGGYYWSSTVSTNKAFNLSFLQLIVSTDYNDERGYGESVRCVAE